MPSLSRLALLVTSLLVTASPLAAQTIGTFRWQLDPYCHLLTLTVVQQGAVYRLDGSDDMCGSARVAPASGLAVPNPDGTIHIGVTIIEFTTGLPVHVSATITLPALGGSWRDSSGNAGVFRFTTGARLPGGFRPIPTRTSNEIEWQQPSGGPERGISARASQETDDTGGNGAAIYGQWGGVGNFPSLGNAGVRGESATSIGVAGVTATGRAVAAMATSTGTAVEAVSLNGTGLRAGSLGAGPAVAAVHGANGTALEISGGVKVSGPVQPVFVVTATSANTSAHVLVIDHPLLNGRRDAMVFVTHEYGGAGYPVNYWNHPTGVYYTGSNWTIYAEDLAPIPAGVRFNVLAVSR